MSDMLKKIDSTAAFLKDKIGFTPEIAIILGSGLGKLGDIIKDKAEIPYGDIPGFPHTTVVGHEGKLIAGTLNGRKVLAMKGRFHYYEGNPIDVVVFPVRVFKRMGIESLIVTNAAGGVNTSFSPGDLMLIKDHISFYCRNPLIGENLDELGPRFPDMSAAYDRSVEDLAVSSAKKLGIDLKTGVYSYCTGPSFETPSEIRAIRLLGGDAVGMSTVPEVIAAKHMGMRILGISCITNMAAGILDQPLNHEEVIETGKLVEKKFSDLIAEIVGNWK